MIFKYEENKSRWEHLSVISYTISNVIINLIKFSRHDMIGYLRTNCPIYSDEKFYTNNFYPFHELVWVNFNMIDKSKKHFYR